MAQRYEARKDYFGNVILPPKNDEGELVLYSDYAALEQRIEKALRVLAMGHTEREREAWRVLKGEGE